MRTTAQVLAVLILVGACSTDTERARPPATTIGTTSASSASSTTTTPASPTSTTTTPASPTSTTTTPPLLEPTPVVFDLFTTTEAREQLSGTHVYLSGWTVDRGFEWAIEQWGRGDAADATEWFRLGGEMEVWVSQLQHRTDDGTPVWNRRDVVVTTYLPGDGLAFSARCRSDGVVTDGLFAWYPVSDDAARWVPAVEAWRIDFANGMAVPTAADAVDCENDSSRG